LRGSHGWHAPSSIVYANHRGILLFPDGRRLLDFLRLQLPKPSAVPLWKVIVGPRAGKLQPDLQGSGFFFLFALVWRI
jgi:hypothetical protein